MKLSTRYLLFSGFTILSLLSPVSSAFATDYVVDSADDTVATDGNLTLREAIQAASTNTAVGDALAGSTSGDTIVFDSTVFAVVNDVTITLSDTSGFGDLEITDDVHIDAATGSGGGATKVTISGANNNRALHVNAGASETVMIDGLFIENGSGEDNPSDALDGLGGGVYVQGGASVTLTDVDLRDGAAATSGGAIYNENGKVTLVSSVVSSNTASGNAATEGGGGIFNAGGTLTIDRTAIGMNQADGTSGSGGGILINDGTVSIANSTLSNNTSNRAGGGVEIRSTSGSPVVTIGGTDFTSNLTGSAPGNGAGIHVTAPTSANATTIDITAGTFSNNIADSEGGGLWNDVMGTMTINGSTIENNTAAGNSADNGGGGIFNNGGTTTVTNATISNNDATGTAGSGGGILNDGGTLTLTGGTIFANSAVRAGGGIEATTANNRTSTVTLTNASLSLNTAGNSPGNGGGIHITDTTATPEKSTITVTGGTISSNTANQEGGGLWNDADGTMTIDGVNIFSNTATAANDAADAQGGGGVFNNGGIVNIQNGTVVSFNTVTGSASAGTDDGGGGIFNDGRNNAGATVTVTDSTIMSNTALSSAHNGGGVINVGGSNANTTVTIMNTTLDANACARAGGGVENNAGQLDITSSTFSGNFAGINGGGIHVSGAGVTNITNTTFKENEADNEGGGLWNSNNASAVMTLTQTTLNDNLARTGGALFNDGTNGVINVNNVTITGNTATAEGGAVDSEGGSIAILNSTLASNAAGTTGGGINADAGTVSLTNSILFGNTATTSGPDLAGTAVLTNSLIGDSTGGTVSGSNNVTGSDPLLAALADNGGAVFTRALGTGSPAIDSGANDSCLAVDARGFVRPQDGDMNGTATCDMGSFEVGFDCNMNGTFDSVDISNGTSTDCDMNAVPDECQTDGDSDGTIDSCDTCPADANKTAPGDCGCGTPDADGNSNGITDCLITPEAATQVNDVRSLVRALRAKSSSDDKQTLRDASAAMFQFISDNEAQITKAKAKANLTRLARNANSAVRRIVRNRVRRFKNKRRNAVRRLTQLNNAIDNS